MGRVVSERLVSVVVTPVGSAGLGGGQLDRDVHVHHLQHLLGLRVNLNNILKQILELIFEFHKNLKLLNVRISRIVFWKRIRSN